MGVTDSSDVQNIKQQQKMNKTGTLTDGEMQSVKVRLHFTKYQICIDIKSEHNCVILSGVIQCINYMLRPLYLAIIRLYLAYSITALHTSVSIHI